MYSITQSKCSISAVQSNIATFTTILLTIDDDHI